MLIYLILIMIIVRLHRTHIYLPQSMILTNSILNDIFNISAQCQKWLSLMLIYIRMTQLYITYHHCLFAWNTQKLSQVALERFYSLPLEIPEPTIFERRQTETEQNECFFFALMAA